MTDNKNPIATALLVIGFLFILGGVIFGLHFGLRDGYYAFSESQGILGWDIFVSSTITGIVFLGFSEIIKLLQGIFNQGEKSRDNGYVGPIEKEDNTDREDNGAPSQL